MDHRADVYSLGVVFYEMLTGDLPIGRFPEPSKKVRVDVRIDEVVLRSLEREREKRYQKLSEVTTGIESASSLEEPEVAASPEPPPVAAAPSPAPSPDDTRLSKLAVAGVLGLPVALVAFGIVYALGARDEHATLVAAGVAFLGFCFSLVAHLEIKRSGGRVRGDRLAKAGITLPVLAAVLAVAVPTVLFYGFYRLEAERVRDEMAHEVDEMMLRAWVEGVFTTLGQLGPAVTPQDLQSLVAPSIREELERTGSKEFLRRHGAEAGLAFFDLPGRFEPLRNFRYEGAEVRDHHAVVTLSQPKGTLRFPAIEEDGEWYFGTGPVEVTER